MIALEGARLRVDTTGQGLRQASLSSSNQDMMATLMRGEIHFGSQGLGVGGSHLTPPKPPQSLLGTAVGLNTFFSQADLGGVTIDLSVNALFSMI